MTKFPDYRGQGLVEWILIVTLVIMVLITIFLLLKPALVNLWQGAIESIN